MGKSDNFRMALTTLLNANDIENYVLGSKENNKIAYQRLNSETKEKLEYKHYIKLDYETACFLLFKWNIEYLFAGAAIIKKNCNYEDIPFYDYGLYAYLKSLYPVFRDIVSTEYSYVTTDSFALHEEEENNYIKKFVTAIKIKKLKQGGCIDRYLKESYISPIVMRLVKKFKGRYLLKNSNTESIDYKLALLSCFSFINSENAILYKYKIRCWEEKSVRKI